ncbi:MAG: hypothetical protein NXY59_07780 [Aigarchaeota archaeon]|nr:hypothetical protein [Candidatus Pelearchaeum maunauluense]
MEKELGILVKPPLKKSSEKAARMLNRDCEALFLNLPKSIDHLVAEIPVGLDYRELVEEARKRKLLPEPVEAWLKDSEPILRKLKELGDSILTYCYKDLTGFEMGVRTSHQIALLTIRDTLRGKIDVKRWLEELKRENEAAREAVKREVEMMESEASVYDKSICLAGVEGRFFHEELKTRFKTWLKYIDQPYFFTPLEILKRELETKGEVSYERAHQLIREHLKFIHDYVLTNELDDAYLKWVRKRFYWHPAVGEKNI